MARPGNPRNFRGYSIARFERSPWKSLLENSASCGRMVLGRGNHIVEDGVRDLDEEAAEYDRSC